MMHDPNPNRARHLGAREFPPDAAGTQLVNGLVLSGDDAPAFERAGFDVMPMHVQCSARIAAGEDAIADTGYGHVLIALERHGATLEEIARWTYAEGLAPATGIYAGTTSRAIVGYIPRVAVRTVHAALKRHHKGFECFAILTPAPDPNGHAF